MNSSGRPASQADEIQSLLDQVAKEIAGLPAERKERIAASLNQIRACVNTLLPTNGETPGAPRHSEVQDLLAAGETKYRELAEAISDPFAAYDADLRLVYRNKASAEATRIPDAQALGKTFGELYPDLVGGEIHQVYVRAIETHQPQRHLTHWVRPADGRAFYYDLSVYPTSSGLMAFSKDVTARVLAEEAHQKSEKKFKRAFQSSPVAQAILRASDRRVIDVNETFLEQTGLTREEAIGHTSLELGLFQNPSDLEKLSLPGPRGTISGQEIKVRTKSGEIRTQLFSLEPVELDEEVCLLVTGIDITDRVHAEDALNERNKALKEAHFQLVNERNRLLAVMETLPIGLAILDEQGGLIQANPAYNTIWGENRPDVSAVDDYSSYQAWWAETGQPVQTEDWASARAVQKGETVVGQYFQIRKFDGSRAYVLNSGAPTRGADGAITGCAVAIMDITKLIEAENALHQSEDRFRVALQALPLMVYTCDLEQRYTWVYQPFPGFRVEDVLGKRDDELISPELATELIAAKQLALDTGQGKVQEINVPANGKDHYYLFTTDPIRDRHGNLTGLTCSAIDINEQKLLQAEQQEQAVQIEVQRRLMEQREQDRYAIARDLHDGPIQTLSGTAFHLQMIKEVFPDTALQAELDQFGADIKVTIHQLRNVLNELRPPALMHFGFSKVLQMSIQDFNVQFPEIKLELDIAVDDSSLSSQTHLALFRIYQAAINNVIRHADASKVWIQYTVDQGGFYFELRDNGKGFEQKKDFKQLTREGHFGLVGMKDRAETIGAAFMFESEPGKGTRIVVKR